MEWKPIKFPKLRMPKRIWTITDVVGISDSAWAKLAWIATIVGFVAISTNFGMVVAYAIGVAVDAPMLGNPGTNGLKEFANVTIGIGQVLVAGMLQLGTDFCLLFAAGLAKSNYRFTPTAALLLWVICAANTLEMKKDIYEAIASGRLAELQAIDNSAAPADVQEAKRLLATYTRANPPPVTQAESQASLSTETRAIADLEAERKSKVAERDDEAATGREVRWNAADTRIQTIDRELGLKRETVRAASVALAQRAAFDAATTKATGWDRRPGRRAQSIGYDDAYAINLRVWGLSLLSFISILVAFAADKASHDRKLEEADKARRSAAGVKAAATRNQNRNTFEADFEEHLPSNTPQIDDQGPTEPGAVAKVDTGRRVRPDAGKHPDRTGDDFGARASGYGQGGEGDATGKPDTAQDE